jgi:hypothetical protein
MRRATVALHFNKKLFNLTYFNLSHFSLLPLTSLSPPSSPSLEILNEETEKKKKKKKVKIKV